MDIINKSFNTSVEIINKLNKTPSNDELLDLYKYYKQATIGNNNTVESYKINFKAHAKWDAWNSIKNMSKESAMQKYIDLTLKFASKYN